MFLPTPSFERLARRGLVPQRGEKGYDLSCFEGRQVFDLPEDPLRNPDALFRCDSHVETFHPFSYLCFVHVVKRLIFT